MNKDILINIAKQYLISKKIDFIGPGEFGRLDGDKQEVIFLDPLVFDPNIAVVDPCDIRVWVNINTKEAMLAEQM